MRLRFEVATGRSSKVLATNCINVAPTTKRQTPFPLTDLAAEH
jgi:hypothetical protein